MVPRKRERKKVRSKSATAGQAARQAEVILRLQPQANLLWSPRSPGSLCRMILLGEMLFLAKRQLDCRRACECLLTLQGKVAAVLVLAFSRCHQQALTRLCCPMIVLLLCTMKHFSTLNCGQRLSLKAVFIIHNG